MGAEVIIEKKREEIDEKLRLETSKKNVIVVHKRTANILEVEDVLFHHNSAVLLPSAPSGPSSSDSGGATEEQLELTGLAVVKAVYVYMRQNPEKKLVIAGHTDTSGSTQYNFELSRLRGENFLYVLLGMKPEWVEISRGKNKVEDYQQILKYYHDKYGWNCDPGDVDNRYGDNTRTAIENFQRTYNSEFGASISITGTMNAETWGAVFDVYMKELAELLSETQVSGIGRWRSAVKFVDSDRKVLPCGESIPIDTPGLDGLKSQTNRRVEMVFFDADDLPLLDCPPSGSQTHPVETCPLYNSLWVDHVYINPGFGTPLDKKIELIEVDPHFAPSKEQLDIEYEIQDFSDIDQVRLVISSEDYPNNPIYSRQLSNDEKSDGIHTINWNGRANCTSGPLTNRFINPLFSPYEVKIVAGSGQEDEDEFKVLYHSINVELGTYTADGNAPDRAAELLRWVQYKLNELGYFAGPVDGVKTDQTRRAMKRYTYAMTGYYGGTPPAKEIDDETNATFQNQLQSNRGRRQLFGNNRLPAENENARAYIDHDYFYETYSAADFNHPQGHCNRDTDKLDRFEIPLQCSIRLVGKSESDLTGAGVDAPEAIGEVDIEWLVRDPIEDTSFLPVPTADIPSRGKQYVESALTATGQVAGNPEDSQDNCPESNNRGQRKTGSDMNPNYFRIGDDLPPFHSESAAEKVYSKVHQDAAASPHKIGRSGILFRGPHISGDNYVIHARISFERLSNKDSLTQQHEDFSGESMEDILFDKTGQMNIWRRHHISAVVNWPDPGRNIDWGEISSAYFLGHCLLDTAHATYDIEDLFTTDADKEAYLDLVKLRYPAYNRNEMEFDEEGLYPLEVPSQGLTEDPADYRRRIRNLIRTFANGSDDFQDDLAKMIYEKVAERRTAGSILFRPNWVRTVRVRNKLPIIGIINPFSSEEYLPGFVCLGLPKGVALLDNGMTHEEQDGFLFAHEMGHCRYLLHHETDRDVHDPTSPKFGVTQYDNPDDHDRNDHNCTMCYPDGIATRPGLTWNKGDSTESRFCGKCLLKLRGWNVRDPALPASS